MIGLIRRAWADILRRIFPQAPAPGPIPEFRPPAGKAKVARRLAADQLPWEI